MAMNTNDSLLSQLKAAQGERHDRDSQNNPQISAEKVPKASAAAKTDSAMGHYVAGIATDNDAPVPNPQSAGSVPGRMVALDDEPELAEQIAAKAQTASNPAAADHFAQAAEGLRAAHEQDKAWLAKHPEKDQGSRQ